MKWIAAVLLSLAGVLGLAPLGAFGQASEVAKPDAATEQRLKALAEELRCLVCQNQTIADSNAPLALDLRNQIRVQIGQGRSDEEIRAYMVQRYGNVILFTPPMKGSSAWVWIVPGIGLLAGLLVAARIVRGRAKLVDQDDSVVDADERIR